MSERVVLVDEDDRELGSEEKLAAHERALLHRAVSVFLFDRRGRVLLQRRAAGKYHSPGLWANACCGHPRPGEAAAAAARRRLREELGVAPTIEPAFRFTYRAEVGPGLWEHELDHVFVGRFDGAPEPDPSEADAWRWVEVDALERDLAERPERYAPWLPLALERLRGRRGEGLGERERGGEGAGGGR